MFIDSLVNRSTYILCYAIIVQGLVLDSIPRVVLEIARREAEKLGMSIDEYLVELVSQSLDPKNRVREYIEAAKELLEQSVEELKKDDIRQAAEKLWGAAALAIKAYAMAKEGKRLSSHGELWEYKRKLMRELGRWVYDSWSAANEMHTCFYEDWCTSEDVKEALQRVTRLVKEVARKLGLHA